MSYCAGDFKVGKNGAVGCSTRTRATATVVRRDIAVDIFIEQRPITGRRDGAPRILISSVYQVNKVTDKSVITEANVA